MSRQSHRIGANAESYAAAYLEKEGFHILARNWRCPAGEIDIVAMDGDTLVIVEVRARRPMGYGTPEESITPAKQSRLLQCGRYLISERGWDGPWRVDALAIDLDKRGRPQEVRLIRSAVEDGWE